MVKIRTEMTHCVKSFRIRSFFWAVFSRIRTEYGEIRSILRIQSDAGKYGPEKTQYFDTFYALSDFFQHHFMRHKILWIFYF